MKRMFQSDVINSGKFSKMSHEAQLLYFRAGLTNDVDGIVDLSEVAYANHIDEEAIKELEENGYVLPVGDDLYAITDWHVHNNIRKESFNRHKPEAKKLATDEKGRYFLCADMSQKFVRAKGKEEEEEDTSYLSSPLPMEETPTEKIEEPEEQPAPASFPSTENETVVIGDEVTITADEYASLKSEIPDFDSISEEVAHKVTRATQKRKYTSIANLIRHIAREDGDKLRKKKTPATVGRRSDYVCYTPDFWDGWSRELGF